MPTDVIMPALGMDQDTGTLVHWIKHEGDAVSQGEPIMEVETDKVVVEIEATASGVLADVTAAEGDEIPVGQVIAHIVERESSESRVLASPKARRLAAEGGVDLSAIIGSGPEGAVLAADVSNADASRPLPQEPAAVLPLTPNPQPLTPTPRAWRLMAERMTAAWTAIPHFALVREVEATALREMHGRLAQAVSKHDGVAPTYTDLLVKMVATAIHRQPRINVSWHDGAVEQHVDVNVGIAVATDDGLIVPVVHGADRLTIGEIAVRRADLAERATAGKLTTTDVAGGTFTLTNLGMYGVDAFTAIVNPPQAAILAVGRMADRVIAVDGTPAVRPTLVLTLSCDHRAVDGARAAQFLEELVALIEEPWGLLA